MATRLFAKVFNCIISIRHLIIFLTLFSEYYSVVSSSIVKSLPGFPGSLPFKYETGYIAVDEKEDVQLFYYFVESEGNPRDDPLMIWFSGGPGCSGLSSFAFEIGPVRFNIVEYNGTLPTLNLNPNSWTKVASIIFIDAPVGSGFSYSRSWEGSQTGDFMFADQSLIFLKKWLLAHPKFISNPLYIGGDSYAGLIVPIIAEEVAKSIEAGNTPEFNFQGYLLGNPVTDINLEWNSRVPFAHHMGLISDELYESVKKNCKGQYQGKHNNNTLCAHDLNAISFCTKDLNFLQILERKCDSIFTANGKMEFNYRKSLLEKSSDFPDLGCTNYNTMLVHFWANDEAVQSALHVHKGTKKIWIRCPKNLPYKRQLNSVVSYHQRLSSRGYRTLIYSGDHDMVVPYIATQAWIKSLNIPVVGQWRPWLVDDQVGGAHTAPEFKPKECFAMFKRWISKEPL
ncbi:serine carboxypeptidase-like 7 [Morus notabilis]|uniref:serine carboxypeptidase-like 7 n=1 Tax=Morus notabilis TaxID=981085 RepID=UPI000CECFCD0|nr:serine carboxypeptidase-like 7 [Morus notabilis]